MLREKALSEEEAVNSKILKLQDSIHQFENVDRDIKAYRLAGGDDALNAAKQAAATLELQISTIDQELTHLSASISDAESSIANLKQLERNIADNLQYRKLQRDINEMQGKIREMETQNAEAEVDNYQEQAERLRRANNKWTAEVTPF